MKQSIGGGILAAAFLANIKTFNFMVIIQINYYVLYTLGNSVKLDRRYLPIDLILRGIFMSSFASGILHIIEQTKGEDFDTKVGMYAGAAILTPFALVESIPAITGGLIKGVAKGALTGEFKHEYADECEEHPAENIGSHIGHAIGAIGRKIFTNDES